MTRALLPVVVGLAVLCGACRATGGGARPQPFPRVGHASGTSVDHTGRDAAVRTALGLRGVPYRDGGSDTRGFDCSGFTQYVFERHGVHLPRAVGEQFRQGRPIAPQRVQPGDLLFFSTVARGASHVAISVGGDAFVHAPSAAGVVRVEHLSEQYWSRRLVGIRRLTVAD
jgi:cell wall-associated NlpC family hydrolase